MFPSPHAFCCLIEGEHSITCVEHSVRVHTEIVPRLRQIKAFGALKWDLATDSKHQQRLWKRPPRHYCHIQPNTGVTLEHPYYVFQGPTDAFKYQWSRLHRFEGLKIWSGVRVDPFLSLPHDSNPPWASPEWVTFRAERGCSPPGPLSAAPSLARVNGAESKLCCPTLGWMVKWPSVTVTSAHVRGQLKRAGLLRSARLVPITPPPPTSPPRRSNQSVLKATEGCWWCCAG